MEKVNGQMRMDRDYESTDCGLRMTTTGKMEKFGGGPEAWKVGVLALSPGRKETLDAKLQAFAVSGWHFVNSSIHFLLVAGTSYAGPMQVVSNHLRYDMPRPGTGHHLAPFWMCVLLRYTISSACAASSKHVLISLADMYLIGRLAPSANNWHAASLHSPVYLHNPIR